MGQCLDSGHQAVAFDDQGRPKDACDLRAQHVHRACTALSAFHRLSC
jgi:hypothetical protein